MTEVKRPLSLHLTSTTAAASQEPTFSAIKRASALSGPSRPAKTLTKSSSISSTKTTSSTSSSSSSCCSSGYDSPDSPSLILPYLYVGDQAQTQIDTISNLNIKYILSLQSLPKFLDTSSSRSQSTNSLNKTSFSLTSELAQASTRTNSSSQNDERQMSTESYQHQKPSAIIRKVNGDEVEIQTQLNGGDDSRTCPSMGGQDTIDGESAGTSAAGSTSHHSDGDDVIARELLPSKNSSKDYLVKFKSCVNKLIKGKCINISDTFEQLVDKFFDETHSFIEEARRNKCNILVHCKAGISRSPTIAIAYLMKWKRLHLQEAYEFVKQCRPQISPNLNFMGQLMNYERQLLQRGSHRPLSCSGQSMLPSPLSFCLPGPCLLDSEEQIETSTISTMASESGQNTTKTQDDLNTSDNDSSNERTTVIRIAA